MGKILGAVVVALLFAGSASPAWADHWETYVGPAEPTREFPDDFLPLLPEDAQAHAIANPWADPHVRRMGEAECERGAPRRTPVVFVHGNGGFATHWEIAAEPRWASVRQSFLDGGYCPRQLWAISYDGEGSYSTYNDVNEFEVYQFINSVRRYLGVKKVNVVAHSLGVTVVRKAGFLHRDLYRHMRRFVAIAGATEGTSTCRGYGDAGLLHVCDEVTPGSTWLDELNSIGHTPKGPEYLTIYDGTGVADDFYLGPDALSPQLDGACNHPLPYLDHFSLGWSPESIAIYLAFLRDGELPECVPFEGVAAYTGRSFPRL